MVDEKDTTREAREARDTKDTKEVVEIYKTPVKVYLDGAEAFSLDVDYFTGVYIQGSAGSVNLPVSPETQLPMAVYLLTRNNPAPVRPETPEEETARVQAEKDLVEAQKRASVPGPAREYGWEPDKESDKKADQEKADREKAEKEPVPTKR